MGSKAVKFDVMWLIGKVGKWLEGAVRASKNFHYLLPNGGNKKISHNLRVISSHIPALVFQIFGQKYCLVLGLLHLLKIRVLFF